MGQKERCWDRSFCFTTTVGHCVKSCTKTPEKDSMSGIAWHRRMRENSLIKTERKQWDAGTILSAGEELTILPPQYLLPLVGMENSWFNRQHWEKAVVDIFRADAERKHELTYWQSKSTSNRNGYVRINQREEMSLQSGWTWQAVS